MDINRKAIKQAAKAKIWAARPAPRLVTLVYLLLTAGVTLAINFVVNNPAEPMYKAVYAALNGADIQGIVDAYTVSRGAVGLAGILSLLLTLYTVVASVGYTAYTLRRTDGEEAGYHDLLWGFGNVGQSLLMWGYSFVLTLGWVFVLMMPAAMLGGIIMMILAIALRGTELALILGMVILWLFVLVATVIAVYHANRYALASYILADHPEEGGVAAVRRSRTLLKPRLWEIFKLQLSFLGWDLLVGLLTSIVGVGIMAIAGVVYGGNHDPMTLGVGASVSVLLSTLAAWLFQMWLTPYKTGTFAQYYRALVPGRAEMDADRPEPF